MSYKGVGLWKPLKYISKLCTPRTCYLLETRRLLGKIVTISNVIVSLPLKLTVASANGLKTYCNSQYISFLKPYNINQRLKRWMGTLSHIVVICVLCVTHILNGLTSGMDCLSISRIPID